MTSLILGGSGFIGSHLAAALRLRGEDVIGFSRRRPGDSSLRIAGKVPWITGDLFNHDQIANAMHGIDTCYHLISTTLPRDSNDDPIHDLRTNVCDTIAVLQAAVAARIKRFVFVSSGGTVYGIPRQIPIEETHPLEPTSSYGIGKLAIEHYLRLFHALYGLDYVVVRLSNPFGPGQDPGRTQGAVSVFLQRVLSGQEIEIWGDGSVVRDYLYIADAVGGLVAAATYRGPERIFNIGSGIGRSLNELVRDIEAACRRQAQVRYMPARGFDVPVNILSVRKANDILGYRPETPFMTGLYLTRDWLTLRSPKWQPERAGPDLAAESLA